MKESFKGEREKESCLHFTKELVKIHLQEKGCLKVWKGTYYKGVLSMCRKFVLMGRTKSQDQ